MLHFIVSHDARIVTERHMAWSNYSGIDLCLLSQVNLMVRANSLDLRCIDFDKQLLVISHILALNLAEVVDVVWGNKVPPEDHSIFTRGNDLVLTHLLCQVMLGQAALSRRSPEKIDDAIFTALVHPARCSDHIGARARLRLFLAELLCDDLVVSSLLLLLLFHLLLLDLHLLLHKVVVKLDLADE